METGKCQKNLFRNINYMNPIIDPATLTEEQREAIKDEYEFNNRMAAQFSGRGSVKCNEISQWHQGQCDELISLLGKDFFKKGE